MNIKLLITGVSVIILNLILGLIAINTLHMAYASTMVILTIFSLVLYFLLLRKDVALQFKSIDTDMRKATALLFLIPLGILIYLLTTSQSVDYKAIAYLFVTSLVVAVYEEILFRGIGLGTLVNANVSPFKAILVSTVIFSVAHAVYASVLSIGIVSLLLNTFAMGFILGYIYYRTNNILFVISIHFIWDFAVFLNQRLPSQELALVTTVILFATTVLYFTWSIKGFKGILK